MATGGSTLLRDERYVNQYLEAEYDCGTVQHCSRGRDRLGDTAVQRSRLSTLCFQKGKMNDKVRQRALSSPCVRAMYGCRDAVNYFYIRRQKAKIKIHGL